MSTLDQIDDFSNFAKGLASGSGANLSIDDLFDRWHESRSRNQDVLAVQASLRDYDAGERGRPIEEFLAELDAETDGGRTP